MKIYICNLVNSPSCIFTAPHIFVPRLWLLVAWNLLFSLKDINTSRYESRLQYENHCGDLAIACVANCPAFRNRCFASHVADSIRNAVVTESTPLPSIPIIAGLPLLPECADKRNRNFCIIAREYERSGDCCPGMTCVPFQHVDGRSAAIGYCHYL